MSDKEKALLSVVLGAVSGSAIATATKISLHTFPPLSFAFIRFLLASILLLPIYLRGKHNYKKELLVIAPISLLASINIILFVIGVVYTTATISQLLYATVPILTSLIVYMFFKERLRAMQVGGVVIGFFGTVVIVLLPIIEKGGSFSGSIFGNVLILFAVCSYAIYLAISKKLLHHASPFGVAAVFIFVTTIVLFPFFVFDLQTHPGWFAHIGREGIFGLLYVVFFGTIGTYILNQYAVKHGGAVYASIVLYLTPVFAYIWAHFLLGEQLTGTLLIGSMIIFFGAYLVMGK